MKILAEFLQISSRYKVKIEKVNRKRNCVSEPCLMSHSGASSPSALSGQPPSGRQILCVCTSQHHEWDRENVIMTGSSDGVVRMWSLDYVEVPTTEVASAAASGDLRSDGGFSSSSAAAAALGQLADRKKSLATDIDGLNSLREVIANTTRRHHDDQDDEDSENDEPETEVASAGAASGGEDEDPAAGYRSGH